MKNEKATEKAQLYRGIFWVKDPVDIEHTALYLTVACDAQGNNLNTSDPSLNSKDGKSLNHERTWESVDKTFKEGKSFSYFPRGRVESANGRADIYCSPYIFSDELKTWCVEKYRLFSANGIKTVRMIADNSAHYRCHYDN